MDSFVTALYDLAEHCNYSALHDELIRDRLVMGLTDRRLSERMQLDYELTLKQLQKQKKIDHNPLLSILGSQGLDALPPRIKRFKM